MLSNPAFSGRIQNDLFLHMSEQGHGTHVLQVYLSLRFFKYMLNIMSPGFLIHQVYCFRTGKRGNLSENL